jgi:hypothetical protein
MKQMTPEDLFQKLEWEGAEYVVELELSDIPSALHVVFLKAKMARIKADTAYDDFSEALQAQLCEEGVL